MINSISSTTTLNNGVQMPWFGLGVYRVPEGEVVENSVRWALEAGYRSIDTAAVYGNESGVGRAIRQSGIPRDQIFVTTKVWNTDQGYEKTLAAFDASLRNLNMEYVDLYLIHWPVNDKFRETWRAFEAIYESGRARAIGVSNFQIHHLEELQSSAHIPPAVDQVEYHPRLQQPDLVAYCQKCGIQLESWRPIMKGKVREIPELVELAEKYHKNPVQITLRWMLQKGIVTIPKSIHLDRIWENANIFDFQIDTGDIAVIDSLDSNERMGMHPDHFSFVS